jgi:predicted nucleic acid-binding protein
MRRLLQTHKQIAVWWGTPVEVHSAVARLARETSDTGTEITQALKRLSILRRGWVEILPTERLRATAEQLPMRYDLRAGDGFQLAAALMWCNERPRGRQFITIDRRLAQEASKVGFAVLGD